jgi:hypothetical protein
LEKYEMGPAGCWLLAAGIWHLVELAGWLLLQCSWQLGAGSHWQLLAAGR